MTYILFLIILLFLLFIPLKNKNHPFLFIYIIFTIFLSLRYGQGTDYFSYKLIFDAVPKDYSLFYKKCYLFGIEPFFYLINVFVKKNSLDFQFVIIISSLITMFMDYKIIKSFSKSYALSFFIIYTNYIVYIHTALRQGIAISIATYAMLTYIKKNSKIRFYLSIFFAMQFHTSAFICFFVPLFLYISESLKIYLLERYLLFSIMAIFFSFFMFPILINIAKMILPRYQSYKNSMTTSLAILPIMARFLFSIIAIYSNSFYKKQKTRKGKCKGQIDIEEQVLHLYLFGSLLFFLIASSNQASRLTDYFSFLEIIYFANVIPQTSVYRKTIPILLIIVLFVTLFVKDINSFQKQGKYYSLNPLEYPYISVFNKEDIKKYRGDIIE